ncbi:hypothetical protein C9I99_22745 [Photobacterium lutimaris]|uniref:Uncharacterized protein n=2 Tax=Photobacterium lutimaris TaxID=388278 RepID=A0A2T3IRA8_9GAMM|nr:hypothetical protein C9I99_22745 [Photobacterium lutimaris]TDR72120.1 hypothetical protein DFP78_11454 [Photobacterium lutimaris]
MVGKAGRPVSESDTRDRLITEARKLFVSFMVFPFLIPPSMLTMQNIEMDEAYLAELVEHNVNVLVRGLMIPKEENKPC